MLGRAKSCQWQVFVRRLLETWSPCSRPFAILPVSAVSDAQKLATGNFLHVRACFLVTFCTTQKVTTRSLSGKFRGLANLDAAHLNGSFAPQQLKPFPKGASRFCKPRISALKQQLRTSPIKSFRRPWRHYPCCCRNNSRRSAACKNTPDGHSRRA